MTQARVHAEDHLRPVRLAFVKSGDVVAEVQTDGDSGPVTFDGMVTYLDEISAVCAGRPHECLVVSMGRRNAQTTVGDTRLEVVDASASRGVLSRVLRLLSVRRRLSTAIREWCPDLTVCLDVGYVVGPVFRATRRGGGHFVLAVPGEVSGGRLRDRARARVVRRVAASPLTMRVLARGTYLAGELRGIGVPADKVESYYPSYEAIPARIAGESPGNAEPAGHTVLFVGRLSEVKGVSDLVPLLQRLPADSDIRLLVIGDGPLRGELTADVESTGLQSRMVIEGARRHGGVVEAMQDADVLVMPSRHEGIGKTAMEAALAGLPVVGYAVGGLGEWVLNDVNGFLVRPGDVDALAAAVRRVVQHEDVRERLRTGTRVVAERVLQAGPTFAESVSSVLESLEGLSL